MKAISVGVKYDE